MANGQLGGAGHTQMFVEFDCIASHFLCSITMHLLCLKMVFQIVGGMCWAETCSQLY